MKKNVFALVFALIMVMSLTLGLTGCGSSAPNGEVNVYNWGEYISNGSDDSVDVVAAFEKLTGIIAAFLKERKEQIA